MRFLIYCAAFLVASSGFAQNSQEDILKEIASYAEKVRVEWKIPGMSISVVQSDSMVFAKGFGVREMGFLTPVTENTVYHIGSVTKSFTSGVMATLVRDRLVSWNDTVKSILPDLDLYDDYVEKNILVKDLMTHTTGLRGQAGTYIPNLGYNRDDIYQMLKYIKPENGFREKFDYNNITFIIAAKVIEAVSGKTWEENVQERIFKPLGMTSSSIGSDDYLAEGRNASVAHSCWKTSRGISVNPIYGKERALHWCSVVGPAGSINSTVVDMAKWAKIHLDIANGDAPSQYQYLHRGQTVVRQDSSMIRLYGQCWYIEKNPEYRMYYHTGTTWGFTAICAFIPELDLGISILCNSEVPTFPRIAIVRRIVDLYLGKTGDELKDRSSESLTEWLEGKSRYRRKEGFAYTPRTPTAANMVGVYEKELPFGDAIVTSEKGRLYLTIGREGWKHRLKRVSGNKFTIRSDSHTFPIYFHMNKSGKITSLEVDFHNNENFGVWKKQ